MIDSRHQHSRRRETPAFLFAERRSDLVYSIITLRHGRWVRAARLRWAEEAMQLLELAAKRGNRPLIAQLKQLEGELP